MFRRRVVYWAAVWVTFIITGWSGLRTFCPQGDIPSAIMLPDASPQTAANRSPALSDPDLRGMHFVAPKVEAVCEQNPADADGSGRDAVEVFAEQVGSMSLSEVVGALDELNPEDLCGNRGRLLVRRWCEFDPAAAALWSGARTNAAARLESCLAVATTWGTSDAAAAMAWARGLADETARLAVKLQVGNEMIRQNPVAAMKLAIELANAPGAEGLMHSAFAEWAATDPLAARDWLLQCEAGGFRQQALANLAWAGADSDPLTSATLIASLLPGGVEQDRAAFGVLQRWVQFDWNGAAAWVVDFPDSPLREQALVLLNSSAPQ